MEYKIFEITYNNGKFHNGDLPHFFYIAKSKEDIIRHSKKYQAYLDRQSFEGGDIWINEISGLVPSTHFENLEDFEVCISTKSEMPIQADSIDQRIEKALEIAWRYGSIDGDHHKAWTIDQMVRALHGSEEEYKHWVAEYENPDDNGDCYKWNDGIAP